jgi:hypothetical protein
LAGFLKEFGFGIFGGRVQRRGAHVSTPKIGSRAGGIVFGGISEFHAVLRRELFWGNLELDFFGVLLGVPRRGTEEGGDHCAFWGNVLGLGGFCGAYCCP